MPPPIPSQNAAAAATAAAPRLGDGKVIMIAFGRLGGTPVENVDKEQGRPAAAEFLSGGHAAVRPASSPLVGGRSFGVRNRVAKADNRCL